MKIGMKALLTIGAVMGIALCAGWAWGEQPPHAPQPAVAEPRPGDWNIWPSSGDHSASAPAVAEIEPAAVEIDVVDARWMALTMWGEARGQGAEAMRAVGHVIDNRRRAGLHGAYVTDTVDAAFQFSCWNRGDPNRAALDTIDDLRAGSRSHAMWVEARRISEEIMAGRSQDPTGGALFYHSIDVAPRWSRGIEPVAMIGRHLFFRTARRA